MANDKHSNFILRISQISDSISRSTPPDSAARTTAALPKTVLNSGKSGLQINKTLDAAARMLAHETSLLSPRPDQYKLEEVDYLNRRVTLTLFYCRLPHFYHFGMCRFPLDPADVRNFPPVVDSVDLDTVFQAAPSLLPPISCITAAAPVNTSSSSSSMAALTVSMTEVSATDEDREAPALPDVTWNQFPSVPISGQVTVVAAFSPTYPSPNSPPFFSITASMPPLHPALQAHMLHIMHRTAIESVAASRGCMEPCIRKVIHLLNTSDFASCRLPDGEPMIHGLLPPVVKDKEQPPRVPSTSPLGHLSFSPLDASVPFPRTSGVRIAPSGIIVAFGLHKPLMEILAGSLPPEALFKSCTPRTYREYRILTEGRSRYFRSQTDANSPSNAHRPAAAVTTNAIDRVISQRQRRVAHCRRSEAEVRKLSLTPVRSRSVDTLTADGEDQPENPRKLKTGSAGSQLLRTPSSGVVDSLVDESSSLRACSDDELERDTARRNENDAVWIGGINRRITFSTQEPEITWSDRARRKHSQVLVAPSLSELKQASRKPSYDRFSTSLKGSPKVMLYDILPLTKSSKRLADNYSLDIANVSNMCIHNYSVAMATNRKDLVQFWSYCATLANSKLRQSSFPGIMPPWAVQAAGRPIFNVWIAHFLKVKDVQSLAMLGLVLTALDAQSTPPALLLTVPVGKEYQWLEEKCPIDNPPSLVGRPPLRSQSAVVPPNIALLERCLNDRMRASADLSDRLATLSSNDAHHITANVSGPNIPLATAQEENDFHQRRDRRSNYRIRQYVDHPPANLLPLQLPSQPNPTELQGFSKRTRSSSYSDPKAEIPDSTSRDLPAPRTPNPSSQATLAAVGGPFGCVTSRIRGFSTLSEVDLASVSSSRRASFADTQSSVMAVKAYLSGQELLTVEPTLKDSTCENYVEQSWFFSNCHILHFTHFVGCYLEMLSTWGRIMCCTRLSLKWHKVAEWLCARTQPSFFNGPALDAGAHQLTNHILIPPSAWSNGQAPEVIRFWTNLQISAISPIYPPTPDSVSLSGASPHVHLFPDTATPRVDADSSDSLTVSSASGMLRCAVCRVVARGIIIVCPQCHHGGHVDHMSDWFLHCTAGLQNGPVSEHVCFYCPDAGCDCQCISLCEQLAR